MNLHERIKIMDINEMAECITMIVYGAIYAQNGIAHLAPPENIKKEPIYEKALAMSKSFLLEEQMNCKSVCNWLK